MSRETDYTARSEADAAYASAVEEMERLIDANDRGDGESRKVIIRDSDGDDTLIISGDHPYDVIDADLGPGNDTIIRTGRQQPVPYPDEEQPDIVIPGGIVLITAVLLLAAFVGYTLLRLSRSRQR